MVDEQGGAQAPPVTSVIFEVEYACDLITARHLAARHARWLFREDEVDAVTVSAKSEYDSKVGAVQSGLPITERYLEDWEGEGGA